MFLVVMEVDTEEAVSSGQREGNLGQRQVLAQQDRLKHRSQDGGTWATGSFPAWRPGLPASLSSLLFSASESLSQPQGALQEPTWRCFAAGLGVKSPPLCFHSSLTFG